MDEDVLQGGRRLRPAEGIAAERFNRLLKRLSIGARDVQRRAEWRDHVDTRLSGKLLSEPICAWTFCLKGDEGALGNDLVARPASDGTAVDDIGDLVPALGRRHLMGR